MVVSAGFGSAMRRKDTVKTRSSSRRPYGTVVPGLLTNASYERGLNDHASADTPCRLVPNSGLRGGDELGQVMRKCSCNSESLFCLDWRLIVIGLQWPEGQRVFTINYCAEGRHASRVEQGVVLVMCGGGGFLLGAETRDVAMGFVWSAGEANLGEAQPSSARSAAATSVSQRLCL